MERMIASLSLVTGRLPQEKQYRLGSDSLSSTERKNPLFSGRQTNEAPIKYFFWSLVQKERLFDKIVLLVSRPCLEENSVEPEGLTTFDYFTRTLSSYLQELASESTWLQERLERDYGCSADVYCRSVLCPVMVPERMEPDEWVDIIEAINGSDSASEPIDLYFDLTGGSRLASMISLLLLRIMEQQDAHVRSVIYGDIQNPDDPKLVDCTPSYEILSSIEEIAAAEATGKDRMARIMEELLKYKLVRPEDVERGKQTDLRLEKSENDLHLIGEEERERQMSDLESREPEPRSQTQRRLFEKGKRDLQKSLEKTPFQKLQEKDTKELISSFYEEIFLVFLEYGLLETDYSGKDKEQSVKDELKANDQYYSTSYYDKKQQKERKKGVISQVRIWLECLQRNPVYRPLKHYERSLRIDLDCYSGQGRKWTSINEGMNFLFVSYIRASGIETERISFERIPAWELTFFSFGFPFMCVKPNGGWAYPKIREAYLRQTRALMERLDALYDSDHTAYQLELKRLLEEQGALEAEIPYLLETGKISLARDSFSGEEEANLFVKTLLARLEETRPFRNAIAHKLQNKFSNPEVQVEIAQKIRTWLREYETFILSRDGRKDKERTVEP